MNEQEKINQSYIAEFSPEKMLSHLDDVDYVYSKVDKIKEDPDVQKINAAIVTRNKLLTNSDWMVGADSALSEEELNILKEYRQTLRDLPNSKNWKNSESDNFLFIPEVPDFKYSELLNSTLGLFENVVCTMEDNVLCPDEEKQVKLEDYSDSTMSMPTFPEVPSLDPKEKPKRARDKDGKFIPDDPSTPDYNEAWEGGKAPE